MTYDQSRAERGSPLDIRLGCSLQGHLRLCVSNRVNRMLFGSPSAKAFSPGIGRLYSMLSRLR